MNFIHEFWVNNFPFFKDVAFVYYFLDLATIYILIRVILLVPTMLLTPKNLTGGRKYE